MHAYHAPPNQGRTSLACAPVCLIGAVRRPPHRQKAYHVAQLVAQRGRRRTTHQGAPISYTLQSRGCGEHPLAYRVNRRWHCRVTWDACIFSRAAVYRARIGKCEHANRPHRTACRTVARTGAPCTVPPRLSPSWHGQNCILNKGGQSNHSRRGD